MNQKTYAYPGLTQLSARPILLLLLACTLCACASQPQTERLIGPSEQWIKQSEQLRHQRHWRLQGRIGIRLPDQAHSASIRWQQSDQQVDILLTGPLGQGSVRIKGDDQWIEIFEGRNGASNSGEPNQLLRQQLGYTLPLGQLSQWCLGLIENHSAKKPFTTNLLYDASGFPLSFRTEHWAVAYQRWKPIQGSLPSQNYTLPHKIVIQSNDVKITLAIKHWEIPVKSST
ncbi:MAG: outer membrane lipoprotein LolB [Gammaproteobacteria bacterium]|nr:MAG: outer membrane lipoprotein LolB [Gammaproteobacteria bacterium]